MTTVLAVCLAFAPMGACAAELDTGSLDGLREVYVPPTWATDSWRDYAAHIVAGESVPYCPMCDLWIACTTVADVERGWHAWGLFPRRWHGYQRPTTAHRLAVDLALTEHGCDGVPACRYLGSARDFRYNWTYLGPALTVGNARGLVVCVEWEAQ